MSYFLGPVVHRRKIYKAEIARRKAQKEGKSAAATSSTTGGEEQLGNVLNNPETN